MDSHLHSQCSLSSLISHLQLLQEKEGNIPVILWDQTSSVTFNSLSDVIFVESKHLYFGGFHVNGSKFCSKDINICEDVNTECDHS